MKAVVTGGTGFIGDAIVRQLLAQGHEVVVVDNNFDPHCRFVDSAVNGGRISAGTYELLPMDVREMAALKIEDVDMVFHLAAHYANERSLREPMLAVSVNMVGTMAVLEFCRKNGVKKLMYASSSGVYGGVDVVAYAESVRAKPMTPYEVTKYSGEVLCSGYCKLYDISLVSPRFFNVYGPGDLGGEWRAVIPNFFSLALRGQPLIVTGTYASRDFTYIDDVVSGVFAGIERVEQAPGPIEVIYNIATGREVFIKELASMIIDLTGASSEIVIRELRNWDNAPRRVGDIHKYRALFPEAAERMRSIQQGLEDSLDWYKAVCS